MPVYEIALPVGAKNLSPNLPTITRSSKDGSIPVAILFGGDNFVGDILEGHWNKGNDGQISQFTALINSGSFEITGKSLAGGTHRYGWLASTSPIIASQESYIDIHMEVPAVTPSYDAPMAFYLTNSFDVTTQPASSDDALIIRLIRTTGGLNHIKVDKVISGSTTNIYASAAVTNNEGTFRIKFRPDDDEIDIYFHDGSGDVTESSDELTLIDDTLDLTFSIAYPAFEIDTEDTTVRTFISDVVTTYQSNTVIAYEQATADIGKGDVKCYDTLGEAAEADWQRVFSEDHIFVGDCVIENGLVRLVVDEAAQYGLEIYYWTGSVWSQPLDRLYIQQDSSPSETDLPYPFLKSISIINRGKSITISVRACDTATESVATSADFDITLSRGKHYVTFEITKTIPTNDAMVLFGNSTPLRWGFVGDSGIGDEDLTLDATNSTLTENYMIHFDDAGSDILGFITTNQKPAGGSSQFLHSTTTGCIVIYAVAHEDFSATEVHIGIIPYQDNNKLFVEAEDATFTGTSVVQSGASGGYVVELDANSEQVYHSLTGITDIPEGRYLALFKTKDSAQVASDLRCSVYNNDDADYLNESGTADYFTLTSSYVHYQLVFDISASDSGDEIRFYAIKSTATTNTIDIDYILIVPISDGESWVEDIAHNEMRSKDASFRVLDLASFEVFAGMGIFSSSLSSGYTDAMAIAAVESEQTLDLQGVLTASTIKTKADNDGFSTGSSDDLRLYHDGTNSYLKNNTGDMILQSLGGDLRLETAEFFLDATGKIQIRDTDDSDVVLLELDTVGRTFQIGQAADLVASSFFGAVTLNTIAAAITDTNKFLVSDSGAIKFRTGTELASDIGAATVPLALTDLASYVQGSIIKGGSTDWVALAKGTVNQVLKMGADEPAWGQVNYSELIGTQPAPVAHDLIDTTGHPVTGLTDGHFLKALSPTTYGFGVHGLSASDVGANTITEVNTKVKEAYKHATMLPRIKYGGTVSATDLGAADLTLAKFPAASTTDNASFSFSVPSYFPTGKTWYIRITFLVNTDSDSSTWLYYLSAYKDGDAYAGWNKASGVSLGTLNAAAANKRYQTAFNIGTVVEPSDIVVLSLIKNSTDSRDWYIQNVELYWA